MNETNRVRNIFVKSYIIYLEHKRQHRIYVFRKIMIKILMSRRTRRNARKLVLILQNRIFSFWTTIIAERFQVVGVPNAPKISRTNSKMFYRKNPSTSLAAIMSQSSSHPVSAVSGYACVLTKMGLMD